MAGKLKECDRIDEYARFCCNISVNVCIQRKLNLKMFLETITIKVVTVIFGFNTRKSIRNIIFCKIKKIFFKFC